jgi:hypothetical protein
MIDEQAASDGGARMNVDIGDPAVTNDSQRASSFQSWRQSRCATRCMSTA